MKKHPEITGRKEVRFLLLGRKSTVKYLTWFLKDHVSILASYKKEEKKKSTLINSLYWRYISAKISFAEIMNSVRSCFYKFHLSFQHK